MCCHIYHPSMQMPSAHSAYRSNLHFSLSARYAHGPVPLQSQHYATSQDIINSVTSIQQEMAKYKPSLTQVTSYSSAFSGHTPPTGACPFKWNYSKRFCLCRCCAAQQPALPLLLFLQVASSCRQQRGKLSIVCVTHTLNEAFRVCSAFTLVPNPCPSQRWSPLMSKESWSIFIQLLESCWGTSGPVSLWTHHFWRKRWVVLSWWRALL